MLFRSARSISASTLTRAYTRIPMAVVRNHVNHRSVNADSDLESALARLDVYIRRPSACGNKQQATEEIDGLATTTGAARGMHDLATGVHIAMSAAANA